MDVEELLRRGQSCAASGDLNGALDAYRQADELGDAEAALMLGETYRRLGRPQLAGVAYVRAAGRGHREALSCLGNMLQDLGNRDGAEAAYKRAVAAGSQMAVFNLGLLLAAGGRLDEAKSYLLQSEANGDTEAAHMIGTVLEKQGDMDGAAAAYLRGAEAGDGEAAFALGRVRYAAGDEDGARSAFHRAHELGYEGVEENLDAWDRSASAPATTIARPDLRPLVRAIAGATKELAAQRAGLRRSWIADTLTVLRCEARAAVLMAESEKRVTELAEVCSKYSVAPDVQGKQNFQLPLPTADPNEWVQLKRGAMSSSAASSWEVSPVQMRTLDDAIQAARRALHQARDRGSSRLNQAGVDALTRFWSRLPVLDSAIRQAQAEVRAAEEARVLNARHHREKATRAHAPVGSGARAAIDELPASMQSWTSPAWETWTPDDVYPGLLLTLGGYLTPKSDSALGTNADFGTDLRVPWFHPLHASWFISHAAESRSAAHGYIRSLLLRQFASARPGELQICAFDPLGLGQSVGDLLDIAEYDADLISGKIWTSTKDLEARLGELAAHIETVIQKYLRTTYETIDDFNDAAGEVAEPYRVLVLFDYPAGVTEESWKKLNSIVENGPRCGVFTILAFDSSIQPAFGVDPNRLTERMRRLNFDADFSDNLSGYQMQYHFEPEALPAQSDVAKRVIDLIGRSSIAKTKAPVTFDNTFHLFNNVAARGLKRGLSPATINTKVGDPKTWWQDTSTRGLFAPIGQKGARDAAILGLDSGNNSSALLVGRQGSGKTTLLHTYLAGLTTLYSPAELELYLIDFKEGVEFKGYAETALPHARVIAIESDREFGLSVLESLESEISRRGELLRRTGGQQSGIQSFREATGEVLPRTLLVFDEFQVLFANNDKVGITAAGLLETIIRQGRGFGIHVLLCSQSISGLDALGTHVLQLLPVRILLPATEADARKVLGENNTDGDFLTTHGDGILNSAAGAVEANERFKGALLPEHERMARLKAMRQKADEAGFSRRPTVFEGNTTAQMDSLDVDQFREELAASGRAPLRLRVGSPMSVGDVGDVVLAREGGANVLAVVRGGDSDGVGMDPASGPAYRLLVTSVLSAAMSTATIDVIDFMSLDDGLDTILEPLLEQRRISLRRRRAFGDTLDSYAAEIEERVEHDDSAREARVLFLFGVHRARELHSEMGGLDVDSELVERLEKVMRDGPEVGVFVWIWADSVSGASRRLSPRMIREAAWRIAGKMSSDDSHSLLGTGQAAELRENQLILANDDRGVTTRTISYSLPSREWLRKLVVPATSRLGEN